MSTVVQKWGNSLALRIPQPLARDSHLHQGSIVDVSLIEGSLVVKPRRQRRATLRQLLNRVTTRNRHTEVDWGGPAGQELW